MLTGWLVICVNGVVLWKFNLKDSLHTALFFPSRFSFCGSSKIFSNFCYKVMFSQMHLSKLERLRVVILQIKPLVLLACKKKL
jgi:hypothetical protein